MSASNSSPHHSGTDRVCTVATAAPSACTSRAEGAALSNIRDREGTPLSLADPLPLYLAVVSAHDRIAPEEFIARTICARMKEIGLGRALDLLSDCEDASAGGAAHGKTYGKTCHG